MGERFDVVVVGGRCAGAPLAAHLARLGLTVCVVDKASFPSDTASTHGIQPTGVQSLERLGVLPRVRAVAAAIERATIRFDDVHIAFDGVSETVGAPMLNVRRVTLDAILLDHAAEAGAEVRTGTAVTDLIRDDGRVTGVETTGGPLRARIVVGADGPRSTIARLAGADEYHRTPPGRAFLWAYFDGAAADADRMWLGKCGDHAYLASPTDGGLFMAAVVVSMARRDEVRADRAGALQDGLAAWPELHACVKDARRVGPVHMFSRWHGFFREATGPGWVLAGDAGHFKDPSPGQGIADALRQVERLAPAIEAALGGDERALPDWWAWRDRDAWDMYWFAHDLGAPGPTPSVLHEIERRIAADPQLTDGLLRVLNHERSPSEVFTPRLALSAAARAFVTQRGRRRAVLREVRALAGSEVRRARAARGASRRTRATDSPRAAPRRTSAPAGPGPPRPRASAGARPPARASR